MKTFAWGVMRVCTSLTREDSQMRRQFAIALVIATVIVTLGASASYADGPFPSFVGCPPGQAIRGINFVTRSLECIPIPNVAALQQQHHVQQPGCPGRAGHIRRVAHRVQVRRRHRVAH